MLSQLGGKTESPNCAALMWELLGIRADLTMNGIGQHLESLRQELTPRGCILCLYISSK